MSIVVGDFQVTYDLLDLAKCLLVRIAMKAVDKTTGLEWLTLSSESPDSICLAWARVSKITPFVKPFLPYLLM